MPAPAARRTSLVARAREAPATLALVAAYLAVFAILSAEGLLLDEHGLVRAGALERGRLWAGEWWRLAAATFLHVNAAHLLVNVAVALMAGRLVERAAGTARFLAVYAASGLAGSALSALGQDAVSAGASGALNGLVGAVLVLHALALGGGRALLRSPGAWLVAGSIVSWAALSLALRLPVDHLAHAGGLVTGAAITAGLTARSPGRAARSSALVAAAVVALCTAAVWPRAEPARYERAAREAAIRTALRAGDRDAAKALLLEAASRGHRGATVEYYRGLLRVQEGDLEGALEILRPLAEAAREPARAEVRAAAASIAKNLGWRHYSGEGAERDARLGLAYLEEACLLGDAESCRNAAAIRGDRAP